jgi:2,3-bisphosphoglycerate-dependent phosphoglycerate mutase
MTASRTILLVKHAMPVVDSTTPPSEWPLSVPGRRRTIALAASLSDRRPTRVVASTERKAKETGEILAATLRVPFEERAELREQERPGLAFQSEPEEFERRIREAFERPTESLFGGESIASAVDRLATGIASLRAAHSDDTLAIVSHGTVMAGFVARVTNSDAFPLWRSLALPSWIALDLDARRVVGAWRADLGAGSTTVERGPSPAP